VVDCRLVIKAGAIKVLKGLLSLYSNILMYLVVVLNTYKTGTFEKNIPDPLTLTPYIPL
jgi:hypothetical protein